MTILTRHFTLEELCASATAKSLGIRNIPSEQEVAYLTALATEVLEPLREWCCRPISISSGYRCPKLNKAVGGVSNSQHVKGQAADINIGGDMDWGKRLFQYIRDHLTFDQLIWEHDKRGVYWIHVSYDPMGNRKQVIDNLLKK